MVNDKTWRELVKLAKHYIAVGNSDLHLYGNGIKDMPWEFVRECTVGGTHRLGIPVSVYFNAKHPSGLTFSWTFDIEHRGANGKGSYEVNVEGCEYVLSVLPPSAKKSFKAYLADCSIAIENKGREFQEVANSQFRSAAALATLSVK